MKNFSTVLLSILLSVLVAYTTTKTLRPAALGQEVKKETAYERVMRTGTIRCGYGISPPILIKDVKTGKISGVDHDIMEAVGKELGLKVEWAEEAGWGDFIEGLRAGRYDAFCSEQWPDAARTRFQTLSMPIQYSFLYAYVRADDHRFDGNLEAINDPSVKIPAIDGDVGMAMAQNGFPKASILTLPQTGLLSDMLMSVKTGKADVIFLEPGMFQEFEKAGNKGVLRKIENAEPSFTYASYYGFNSGETQLRDMVNVALRTLIDNGRLEKIAHSYSPDYIIARKNY
jgi:polar amino acid transport system substrate-binding protein